MKTAYNTVDGGVLESSFLHFLNDNRESIKRRIFDFVPAFDTIMSEPHGLDIHKKMLADYPERGGKYVRPGLILLSTMASGGEIPSALTTAAAMEISEDWILIHDDFMDHSLERRGKPALHQIYGDELAINAGDHLHILMWKTMCANCDVLGQDKTFELVNTLGGILETTCEGQYLELVWTRDKKFIDEVEYYAMIDRKTGWYTISGPLRLGAIIADNRAALEPILEFGIPLGRAFQIHDDWLNLFSANTGKEIGGDVLEGKRTLILIDLMRKLEEAGEQEKTNWIREIFSMEREQKSFDVANRFIEMAEEFGCREFARQEAKKYAQMAKDNLHKIPGYCAEGRAILEDAVDFIVNREL